MPRPYRIELTSADRTDGRDQHGHQEGAPRALFKSPSSEASAKEGPDMWGVLGEIQSRLDNVKTEISALRTSGGGNGVDTGKTAPPPDSQSANAQELHAVITATESATNTILAAAEEVGEVAESLASDGDPANEEHAETLLNAMVTIYQACNFQDISGQRLARVISSLTSIDTQLSELMDAWQKGSGERPTNAEGDPDSLLNGPARDSDDNVVSQNDVDALFP